MEDLLIDKIVGIGTDIIEIDRVNMKISKNIGFKEKVFSENEISYCESKPDKALNYAGRFAAKESFLKAIGTGWRTPLSFNEIEIINDVLGKPEIILYGETKKFAESKSIKSIHCSISHIKEIVNAIVLLQSDKEEIEMKIFSSYVNVKEFTGIL